MPDWGAPFLPETIIDRAAAEITEVLGRAKYKASYTNARRSLEIIEQIVLECEAAGMRVISVSELREAVDNIKRNEGMK